METKEKVKETLCSYVDCTYRAVWKATSTKESIAKIPDDENRNKHLFNVGTWFYCDEHKNQLKDSCPHLSFEAM